MSSFKFMFIITFFTQSVFITLTHASNEIINTSEKTYYIEDSKSTEWLLAKMTRIFSLVIEVEYTKNITNETKHEYTEHSYPVTDEGCKIYDVDNKYTEYKLIEALEKKKSGQAPYSNWFEAKELDGNVTKKIIVYCFAN